MPIVIGVRFKDSGKVYHFDPRDIPLAVGDWAIVETVRGPELGRIAAPSTDVAPEEVLGELKPVLRRATEADLHHLAHLQQYLDEALDICGEKVTEHKLPMALVKAEYNFDGSRLTFFFTAEKRVDFRALVRDLARTFHTRIELRQVGPRDEAKLLGGIGPCGRLLCCSTFLPDFARVSIKMAKDQDLPLNPVKISGVCGRLLCCLSYEHEQYLDIKAELPPRGTWVQTPEGPGEVVAVNVVRETVTVELTNGNTLDCSSAQIGAVTEQVIAEARARNAEGITPVARMRMVEELQDDADVALLEALEDRPAPRERPRTEMEPPAPVPQEPATIQHGAPDHPRRSRFNQHGTSKGEQRPDPARPRPEHSAAPHPHPDSRRPRGEQHADGQGNTDATGEHPSHRQAQTQRAGDEEGASNPKPSSSHHRRRRGRGGDGR
jgi:cell fate regulator YaaT (PSP1 superfamily)